MHFQIEKSVEILSSTPGVLRAMLDGKSEEWTHRNYGERTFSPFDVVGHLIHGEKTDWIPRARIILDYGDAQPFEPFDRYAQFGASKGKSLADLLDEFEKLRRENLQTLAEMNLSEKDLGRPGRHPELGAVTMRNLLATWTCHDLNHIAQIAKAQAFQYETEVGAWKEYISILKPPLVRADR